jgi:hypothetical protein
MWQHAINNGAYKTKQQIQVEKDAEEAEKNKQSQESIEKLKALARKV